MWLETQNRTRSFSSWHSADNILKKPQKGCTKLPVQPATNAEST